MYTVALVQNQSEMSHYGYADARPLFADLNYRPVLYTAQNIDALATDLKRLKYDALILASNALNDKTIREVVLSDDFKAELKAFLEKGRGCLVLHQLRMAQSGASFQFLPSPLDVVVPTVRQAKETASDGTFFKTGIVDRHVCFVYPNHIEVPDLEQQCLSFPSLRGLYWHFLEGVSQSDWDVLLYDLDTEQNERPLLVASKESETYRIVLSSLTLDWQKQKNLLQNVLTYVVEGKHYTAVVRSGQNKSSAFEYLLESLRSQKYPFATYTADHDLSELVQHVQHDVHTIIVLDPFVVRGDIPSSQYAEFESRISEGKLKLLGIQHNPPLNQFYVAGRERYAIRLLYDVEIKVQKELNEGYIDGSFWSTAEALQILCDIPYRASEYDASALRRVFELADTHDRDGAYDEVFGVTCALLWLRAKHLGKDHLDTKRTLAWIRKYITNYDEREQALAYHTMIDVGIASDGDRQSLRHLLIGQKVGQLSEIDLIVYLRASVAVGDRDVVAAIVKRLETQQTDGYWVDLATTATATSSLLIVLRQLRTTQAVAYSTMHDTLETMIFKAIIYLQNSQEVPSVGRGIIYPWDNKASTSLKCIEAWLRFEELVDLPIHEIIDTLRSYSRMEISSSSTKTALSILEELKEDNRSLLEQNRDIESKNAELEEQQKKWLQLGRTNKFLWIITCALLYFCLVFVGYAVVIGPSKPVDEIARTVFLQWAPYHVGAMSLVLAVIGIYLRIKKP